MGIFGINRHLSLACLLHAFPSFGTNVLFRVMPPILRSIDADFRSPKNVCSPVSFSSQSVASLAVMSLLKFLEERQITLAYCLWAHRHNLHYDKADVTSETKFGVGDGDIHQGCHSKSKFSQYHGGGEGELNE